MKYIDKRPTVTTDTECLPGYWSIAFMSTADRSRRVKFELYEGHPLDTDGIRKVIARNRIVSFNGNHYDIPMICLALTGASTEELKAANDTIIVKKPLVGLKPWEFMNRHGLYLPRGLDHIDLIQVAPSAARDSGKESLFTSLKMYGAMMGSKKIQDMPVGHDTFVTEDLRPLVAAYCYNDLELTCDLWDELQPQITLRMQMSDEYGVDMRSKSDAQVGEQVMKCVYEKETGRKLYANDEVKTGAIKFVPPKHINFQTPELQQMFDEVMRASFIVRGDGYIVPPKELEGRIVTIGGNRYMMGIGGLHSMESSISHYADEDTIIVDTDVTGYYPNNMIATGREPDNMRGIFQPAFRRQVSERTAAKRAGQVEIAESRKIVCNGLFGKTSSRWSVVYSPEIMIQTTLGGQLSLLMFIEQMTLAGFQVISANTDGVVTKLPRKHKWWHRGLVMDWEIETSLEMEYTEYSSVHSRDVNTYIAFTVPDEKTGKVKIKRKGKAAVHGRGIPGAYGLKKNPDAEIAYDAVVLYLQKNIPLERTIYECKDIRKFLTSTKVGEGGAMFNGEYVGKTIRFYHCNNSSEAMFKRDNGNKVPKSDACWPCMELPDEFPENVDMQWYLREANAILNDVGMKGVDPALAGRTGTVLAHMEEKKTIHTVELPSGIALCGATRETIRDKWVEFDAVPDGHRHCKKCRDLEV